MNDGQPVYHLALREIHAAMGAVFTTAEGWAVPATYGDADLEYEALRSRAAVFDRSARSRILVTGTDAAELLGKVLAGHPEEIEEGRSRRTVALDADGCIRDLLLVSRTGGIAYFLSGEPGQRAETLQRLREAAPADFDVRIDDRTETTCLIGLAGPDAAQTAATHLSEALPGRLGALHCVAFEFHGFRGMAVRASDTGEDGFELLLAPAVAQHLLETLHTAGIAMAGRSALEAARVEACIPAFDADLAPGLSPAEADLDVLLDIPGGREGRLLSALLLDGEGPIAPGGSIKAQGARVGELRSSVRSPALNATAGLGIIEARHAYPGSSLMVAGIPAVVVAKPLYRRRG